MTCWSFPGVFFKFGGKITTIIKYRCPKAIFAEIEQECVLPNFELKFDFLERHKKL